MNARDAGGGNALASPLLMAHSNIGVTMNAYTHLGLEDAKDEMIQSAPGRK